MKQLINQIATGISSLVNGKILRPDRNHCREDEVARVYRGEGVDAFHYASIAVVDARGRVSYYLGEPDLAVMARSSIKPFQMIPLLTTGAFEHYGFSLKQLAVMVSSHNGSDEHVEVVRRCLELSGTKPEALQCGSHWPLGMQLENVYPTHGEDTDPLRHNCSGKHAGFLALAKFIGEDIADYLNPEGKVQQMVKRAVADFCEYPIERMTGGIDGCSAPNFPIALQNIALGFKKLAAGEAADEKTATAVKKIRQAMLEYPEMVSGEKRFDLDLMRSFPDNVISKFGAESLEGIGFTNPPLGIAVKVLDGNSRVLGAVVISILKQLGLIQNIHAYPLLEKYETPEIRNDKGTVTGHIVIDFTLRRA